MYRADMEARVKFYDGMIKLGVMSINEIRGRENMNPVDGGNTHFVQVNQIALNQFEEYSAKIANENVPKLADVTEEDNGNEE